MGFCTLPIHPHVAHIVFSYLCRAVFLAIFLGCLTNCLPALLPFAFARLVAAFSEGERESHALSGR